MIDRAAIMAAVRVLVCMVDVPMCGTTPPVTGINAPTARGVDLAAVRFRCGTGTQGRVCCDRRRYPECMQHSAPHDPDADIAADLRLFHTGTHAFDVLRFWCGEALEASGRLEARRLSESASIVDVGGTAEILMSSGATAFVSARRKRFYIFQFDLLFEDARILLGNDIAQVYRPGRSRLYCGFRELFLQPDFDWGRGYGRGMVEDLLHSMTVGAEPLSGRKTAGPLPCTPEPRSIPTWA